MLRSAFYILLCIPCGTQSVAYATDSAAASPHRSMAEEVHVSFLRDNCHLVWDQKTLALDDIANRWEAGLPRDGDQHLWALSRPADRDYRLFAESADIPGQWPIAWPSDLVGMVNITTPRQALEFVRLFSSVRNCYRFPEYGYLEVAPVDELTVNWTGPAFMPRSDFERLGLPGTTVIEHEGTFRIRRPVAKLNRWRIEGVAVLDETVTKSGRYVLRVLWYKDDSKLTRSILVRPSSE